VVVGESFQRGECLPGISAAETVDACLCIGGRDGDVRRLLLICPIRLFLVVREEGCRSLLVPTVGNNETVLMAYSMRYHGGDGIRAGLATTSANMV
jgi:hypothetical protein